MPTSSSPPVCDYEGSDYRTRFWENQGREYEDQVERVALRRLLGARGETLIDLGAGFGRLANEYGGYGRVVLFDYSRTLLREAQARLGDDPRFLFVAGDWYRMPFVDGRFDAMVQVRTIHHAADVPRLFAQLRRIARPGGEYILEFANKCNLKAIARWLLRRQDWNPFRREPVEFVPLNFDFHPAYIEAELEAAGFAPVRRLSVSHFRFEPLKKLVPTGLLVAVDRLIQPTGRWWQLTPSVFVRSLHPVDGAPAPAGALFACPDCGTPLAPPGNSRLTCPACRVAWPIDDGIYDFKESVPLEK